MAKVLEFQHPSFQWIFRINFLKDWLVWSPCSPGDSQVFSNTTVQKHQFSGAQPQGYGFSSSHVWIWELDYKETWAPKNWCFWTVVLEKTLESPLDCKEIQPVHPEGDQSWVFIGRTDAETETPVLGPPHAKSWLIGKNPDAGRDWGQEEKGMTEDEMAGWHHRLDGREFEETLGVGDWQGGLECCGSWGRKESDTTKWLNWTELNFFMVQPSHPYMTTGKNIALTIRTFDGKVISLLFNMLSRFVIAFLPRSKHLLISWLQSPSAVILEPKKIKSVTISIVSPSICHEVIVSDAMIFSFWMLSFKPTFSLSSFTFIKRLFSSSSLSVVRVVLSAYLRFLIFLLAILIPACASSRLAFRMIYSAHRHESAIYIHASSPSAPTPSLYELSPLCYRAASH